MRSFCFCGFRQVSFPSLSFNFFLYKMRILNDDLNVFPEIKSYNPIMSSIFDFTHNFTSTDTLDNQQLASLLHPKIIQTTHTLYICHPKRAFVLDVPSVWNVFLIVICMSPGLFSFKSLIRCNSAWEAFTYYFNKISTSTSKCYFYFILLNFLHRIFTTWYIIYLHIVFSQNSTCISQFLLL